jgi:hypothetical protein
MSPTPASAPKKDRTSVPAFALLLACGISAYGFRAESAALTWAVPAAVVALSLVVAFWPSRPEVGKTEHPQ